MSIWRTLYRFEMKKILQKRFTIAALLAIYLFIVFGLLLDVVGSVWVNNTLYMRKAELNALDKSSALALSGRRMDEALMREAIQAFQNHWSVSESFGDSPTEEQKVIIANDYLHTARPYAAIMGYCQNALGKTPTQVAEWEPDWKEFDAAVQKRLREQFDRFRLTEAEQDYWMRQYEALEKPLVFQYSEGYRTAMGIIYALSVLLILFIGIALSGSFSEERVLRCDQLILASKNGRGMLYCAKIAAGLTVTAAAALGLILLSAAMTFAIYGLEGFSTPLQLHKMFYPYPITVGHFLLIMYGVMFIVLLLISAVVMLLSVCFRRTIVPVATVSAAVMIGLFLNIPENMRILAQIWDCLPVNFVFASNIYDLRLISFWGHSFVAWQILPVIYLAAAAIFVWIGKLAYDRHQVCGG